MIRSRAVTIRIFAFMSAQYVLTVELPSNISTVSRPLKELPSNISTVSRPLKELPSNISTVSRPLKDWYGESEGLIRWERKSGYLTDIGSAVIILVWDHGTSIRWYCKTSCPQMYPPSWNPSMSENFPRICASEAMICWIIVIVRWERLAIIRSHLSITASLAQILGHRRTCARCFDIPSY